VTPKLSLPICAGQGLSRVCRWWSTFPMRFGQPTQYSCLRTRQLSG